MLVLFSANDLP